MDQASLIPSNKRSPVPSIIYVCTKIFPILTFLNLVFLNPIVQIIVFILVSLADFWLTKNVCGMQLIGLRWYFEFQANGKLALNFYSKPDPFVPTEQDSNTFWMLFITEIIAWAVIAVVELFLRSLLLFLNSTIIMLIQLFNFLLYVKVHKLAKEAMEREVLHQIQGEAVSFPMAKSDYSEEETVDEPVDPDILNKIQISDSESNDQPDTNQNPDQDNQPSV
ncbi:hypothetical protein TVAG_142300 [Trichomonas vaginalis G3]|uniref:Golgi apparatus membrane protein TVP23 homolog n=1 Tax=Trichomonas vaginalis (strain ATCC PRA-98 / G3) TaxID=412133 RepID=A2EHI9_TRIV3|nr:Golgi APPARATUS membrane protein TVP23 family [Trichomonas vaginalis G3]EAY07876.1 hypothetical protein TVAG_142300 [Trichomonas vaginalis G3]KAI5514122.1 Golgi APPARATUS membrane protein TVP23 family [Trichomonas vaginalis G3]|eukprot:XP_001320099.1 hypothetical protein [Trichomonas vaginalis G3]